MSKIEKIPPVMGRPTKYKPEYCEQLIEHMSKGLSYESFAGLVSVSKQTIYDWEENFPEFLDAKKIGIEKCRLWWEEAGIDGLNGENFKAANWIYNMKSRFPSEWREKKEIQISGGMENKTLVNFSLDEIQKMFQEAQMKINKLKEIEE